LQLFNKYRKKWFILEGALSGGVTGLYMRMERIIEYDKKAIVM